MIHFTVIPNTSRSTVGKVLRERKIDKVVQIDFMEDAFGTMGYGTAYVFYEAPHIPEQDESHRIDAILGQYNLLSVESRQYLIQIVAQALEGKSLPAELAKRMQNKAGATERAG